MILNFPGAFTYCEGYAVGAGLIPVAHAWVINNATGKVIDKTWAALDHFDPAATGYYGIPVKIEYLRKQLLETKCYGVLTRCLREINADLIDGTVADDEWIAGYSDASKRAA